MSIRPLTPELRKVAAEELFEVPNRLPQDIQTIKDWLAKQRHLKARTDDQWLIAFLRGCKFSLERTKEKLDNYYTMKTISPELSKGVDPMDPKLQHILDKSACFPLPKLAHPGAPRYILFRIGDVDPKEFDPVDIFKTMYVQSSILMLEDDSSTVVGTVALTDVAGVTTAHLAHVTPSILKQMVISRQDAMPMRLKGSHNFNAGFGFETIFNLIKTMLSAKNRNRFFVHAKSEEMFKIVPKEVLPFEYGGNGGSLKEISDYWRQKYVEYRNWFLEDVQYKTDESKRPGKPKTAEEFFGVSGSFRQLEFD